MNRTAGVWIIIVALFVLWLFNTGRLEQVIQIVQNGAIKVPQNNAAISGNGYTNTGGGTSTAGNGGATTDQLAACYAMASAGDYSCVGNVWTAVNSPQDVLNTFKNVGNSLIGWTGIRL